MRIMCRSHWRTPLILERSPRGRSRRNRSESPQQVAAHRHEFLEGGGKRVGDDLRTNALEIDADRALLRQRDERQRVGMRDIEIDARAFFQAQVRLAMRPVAQSDMLRRTAEEFFFKK